MVSLSYTQQLTQWVSGDRESASERGERKKERESEREREVRDGERRVKSIVKCQSIPKRE
jgi:hypothetical protein